MHALFRTVALLRPPSGLIYRTGRGSPVVRPNLSEASITVRHATVNESSGNCHNNEPIELFWSTAATSRSDTIQVE